MTLEIEDMKQLNDYHQLLKTCIKLGLPIPMMSAYLQNYIVEWG